MLLMLAKPTSQSSVGTNREPLNYAGNYGWIMIGARDHVDALNEANRSLERSNAKIDRLQVWNGGGYVPCGD